MTEIEQFIQVHIKTVDHLRAVLLVQNDPARHWDTTELGIKLHLPPALSSSILADLEGAGLISCSEESLRYFFHAKTDKINGLMKLIVELDRERPVTLLNMIYARPRDIQAFTDAFRLRKDKDK